VAAGEAVGPSSCALAATEGLKELCLKLFEGWRRGARVEGGVGGGDVVADGGGDWKTSTLLKGAELGECDVLGGGRLVFEEAKGVADVAFSGGLVAAFDKLLCLTCKLGGVGCVGEVLQVLLSMFTCGCPAGCRVGQQVTDTLMGGPRCGGDESLVAGVDDRVDAFVAGFV
jgi:hypothetical protein